MNDFKSILDSAVSVDETPVDPAADIARGRKALRQRRMTRLGAGAAGLAVVAAVGGVLSTSSAGSPAPAATSTSAPAASAGLQLVAYTGDQVPGYQVGLVPKGWEIQGGDDTVLVLAPKGFKNRNTDDWNGKIAVQLQSKDTAAGGGDADITDEDLEAWGMTREEFGTPVSTPVTVNGQPGTLTRNETSRTAPLVSLAFPTSGGHHVLVQGPPSLRWNDRQWVEFAEGVDVLVNAEAGVG